MSLLGANFVRNSFFNFVKGFAGVKHDSICLAVSLMNMPELLVLKNLTKCNSQRLKRPSGAQVMTRSRSLIRSVARSLCRSVARSIVLSLDRLNARSLDPSLVRSLDHSIARSIARWLAPSIARSIAHSHAWSLESFRGFEIRTMDFLGNYCGGSNVELLACVMFISPVSEFRNTFQKNYDRSLSLFQGVYSGHGTCMHNSHISYMHFWQ